MATKSEIIRRNYDFYTEIIESEKTDQSCLYSLKEDRRYFYDQVSVINELDDNMQVHFRISRAYERKYNIHLSSENIFGSIPLIRFESSGPAHKNRGSDIINKKISTPHFHRFNQNGVEYAYHSERMKEDPDYADVLSRDFIEGVSHFYEEANIVCNGKIEVVGDMFIHQQYRESNMIFGGLSFQEKA